jgi:hypothetical protein
MLAKATDAASRSDGIVVSFGWDWYQKLRNKTFKAVIRKRMPTTMKARWLYFHINAPKSAICARAEIDSVNLISTSEACKIAKRLDLSVSQIVEYLHGHTSVGCYELGQICLAKKEISAEQVAAHMVYNPPQSFFVLSQEAKAWLNQICEFGDSIKLSRGAKTR